jgi:poly(3-hydroxybutyrate) depolymerase
MKTLLSYYQNYNNATGNIATEFDVNAEHCLPTIDYGEACAVKKSPYIGKCDYDGAGIALNHLYGTLKTGTAVASHLMTFDQTPFIVKSSSLGNTGYIYVPGACADGKTKCKLHISFHGCVQDLASIGNQYADKTGFNDWAEANNIIVLYPYAVSSVMPSNPNACWDWWGYTGADYVYQTGKQMKFVKDLIDHITAR